MTGEFGLGSDSYNSEVTRTGGPGTSYLDQYLSSPGSNGEGITDPRFSNDGRGIVTTGQGTDQVAQQTQRWEVQQNRNGLGGNALELRYGDPDFQAKLAGSRADTLKITGLPANVGISEWADDKGFFIWFADGQAQHQRMYLPSSFKNIEVNGYKQNVDELKLMTADSMMAESKGTKGQPGFYSFSGRTSPLDYGKKLAGIAGQSLVAEEKFLRDGIASSPNNPYFHIYLSDVLLAKAIQPVLQQLQSNQPLQTNNPQTLALIDESIKEAKLAQQYSAQGGNLRVPDTQRSPLMSPFGLNPYFYNPDLYWGGALYQSYQREVSLTMLKGLIQAGVLDKLELP